MVGMTDAPDSEPQPPTPRTLAAVTASIARRPGVWVGLAVLLVVGLLAAHELRGPRVEVVEVGRADIEQRLVAIGRVRVVTRVSLLAQASGRVVRVAVEDGARVRAGDLLVQLEDGEARAAVAEARAAVAQARGRVEQLREVNAIVASEQLREAEANVVRAEADYARVTALASAGAAAARDVEEAGRQLEVARAARVAARARQDAANPRGADARIAENALRESEARLAAAEVRLDQTRVVATQDGVVLLRHVDPGDIVRAGDTLIDMAGEAATQIVIEPDERNLAWLRVGQPALASADAYPDRVFDARIAFIAPAVDRQRGSIEVRLDVPDPPDELRPDMTVSVDLTVASRQAVLTVPTEAIRDAASATPWVLVVERGVAQRRDVTLGITGEGQSEIRSGLAEGALVALRPAALQPGQRVRAGKVR